MCRRDEGVEKGGLLYLDFGFWEKGLFLVIYEYRTRGVSSWLKIHSELSGKLCGISDRKILFAIEVIHGLNEVQASDRKVS